MRKYFINPCIASESQIASLSLEECDVAGIDYQHAKLHGFIWDTEEDARVVLRHMLQFGKRIREESLKIAEEQKGWQQST